MTITNILELSPSVSSILVSSCLGEKFSFADENMFRLCLIDCSLEQVIGTTSPFVTNDSIRSTDCCDSSLFCPMAKCVPFLICFHCALHPKLLSHVLVSLLEELKPCLRFSEFKILFRAELT